MASGSFMLSFNPVPESDDEAIVSLKLACQNTTDKENNSRFFEHEAVDFPLAPH